MKKWIPIIATGLLALSMSACGVQKQPQMTIRPSTFSEETKEVLSLFDDEIHFFDIELDDTAKSFHMAVWVYRNGVWEESARTEGQARFLGSRIAIRLTDNRYDLYTINESGHEKYSLPNLNAGLENCIAQGGEIIDREIPLVLHQETPIWVKIGTDTGSMRVGDITDDFRQIACSAGIAVTLTVSDQEVA